MRQIALTTVFSLISAFVAIGIYKYIEQDMVVTLQEEVQPVQFTNFNTTAASPDLYVNADFTHSAKLATPAVVHVRSTTVHSNSPQQNPYGQNSPFHWFFDQNPRQNMPRSASGSGVIISQDGYIVTNHHVVNDADEISITLSDNKEYIASVVGTDPSTDLALLKIEEKGLPFLSFTNSDSVMVGEWVLAVGNPFNLASTATAGIVSAKGRNINILEGQAAIESFIQTDAAVNPGNSGGALVDLSGNLVGINTAIASPTGAFAGYSFAVPANLVHKVVSDLKDYGIVQRGFLGVSIRNIDSKLADDLNLRDLNGVYVDEVMDGGAASEAGLQSEDVITRINGKVVNSSPQLQEVVAQYRPGDEISVSYVREGKQRVANMILKNKNQNTELLVKETVEVMDLLGLELQPLTIAEKKELGLENGVKVKAIREGRIRKYTDMEDGFVITSIDKKPVETVEDITEILENKKGGVMLEGIYPGYPGSYYYAFGM